MRVDEIQTFPQELTTKYLLDRLVERAEGEFGLYYLKRSAPVGFHESLVRSYQIVQKVKELLDLDTPPSVVREMIEVMEA